MRIKTRRGTGLLLGLVYLGVVAQSCLSFDAYCDEVVDCEDGNEADMEACVVANEAAEDRASLYGCTDEFEIFFECLEAEAKCEDDRYTLTGNDCDDESREYQSCLGDNLPPAPF